TPPTDAGELAAGTRGFWELSRNSLEDASTVKRGTMETKALKHYAIQLRNASLAMERLGDVPGAGQARQRSAALLEGLRKR
ncbi:MAG: hypothetical protein WC943_15375, partial [Elusimicrobiota bacterium]